MNKKSKSYIEGSKIEQTTIGIIPEVIDRLDSLIGKGNRSFVIRQLILEFVKTEEVKQQKNGKRNLNWMIIEMLSSTTKPR